MDLWKMPEWTGTMAASAAGALLACYLKDWIEERRARRQSAREQRRMRVGTDRSTYNQRLTILIRSNLATYIRSGKWHTDEQDLRRLLADLNNGNYEHFLDREVNQAWHKLIRKTVVLGKKRLAGTISELDIRVYNVIRKDWEDSAKRSFGPFPQTQGLARPRPRAGRKDHGQAAA